MNGHDELAIAWIQRTASDDPDYQAWLANEEEQREYQEYLESTPPIVGESLLRPGAPMDGYSKSHEAAPTSRSE